MESYKLRLKIGPHEFEAEGPEKAVNAKFEEWKALIAAQPHAAGSSEPPAVVPANRVAANTGHTAAVPGTTFSRQQLTQVFEVNEKQDLVTLRDPPSEYGDALLVALYGYRKLRDEDEVLTTQIKAALLSSGLGKENAARAIGPHANEGLILRRGLKKASKLRLTTKGMAKAEEMVRSSIAKLT